MDASLNKPRLLIDIDAGCKLAHWGLLAEVPAVLGVGLDQCASLTSLRFRAMRCVEKPDGRLFRTCDAAQAVLAALNEMLPPVAAADVEHLAVFENVPSIDAGEAVLLAAALGTPGAHLLTGDKRAVRALAQLTSVAERLAGRILLVEHVVLGALNVYGLNWLRGRICPQLAVDKAIGICMGSRCDVPDEAVRHGLASYVQELEQLCEPTLIARYAARQVLP